MTISTVAAWLLGLGMILGSSCSAHAQVPPDMVGRYTTKAGQCAPDISPDEGSHYVIQSNAISFYEIDCHIRRASPVPDGVALDADCIKGGGSRTFTRIVIRRLGERRLSLAYGDTGPDTLEWCGPFTPTPPADLRRSRWMHNGSAMRMDEAGGSLEITYVKPRAGTAAAGVREGTVLVIASRNGDTVQGGAYIFHPKCGPARFEVEGKFINPRTLVLKGEAPRFGKDCAARPSKRETLRFNRTK